MKKIIKIALLLAITAIMVSAPVMNVYAADYMAYNIYSDPVNTSGASGKYDTFTIEFRGVQTPQYTYWALANFGLDLTSKKNFQKFPAISGGGAYAGLQNTGSGKVAIMSFWEMPYGGTKIHNVKQMYPEGDTDFGGEGNGKKCITSYEWDDNTWYRMVIHVWDDKETGTTFAGQWFQNVESGEWTLLCYYDTGLYESCFKGGMGLFQENYIRTYEDVRSFNTRNIYAIDHKTKEWVSFDTCKMSYGDGGGKNKAGAHSFGISDDASYFWGQAGGKVDNQEQYEKESVTSQTLKINQAATPTFGTPKLNAITLEGNKISWEVSAVDMPQLSYKLEITDAEGKTLVTKEQSRPEVSSVTLDELKTDAYKATLTVTDLFGKTTTLEKTTEAYDKAIATPTPEPTPENTSAPATTTPTETTPTETESNPTGIIVAAVAGAIVVIGVVVFFIIKKKSK